MRYVQMYYILRLVLAVWNRAPQLRLGQLLVNAISQEANLYYIEDAVLVEALRDYSKELDKI